MSSSSTPTAEPSAPSPSHGSSAATLSVGLAIGMVFCLIAFVFISVAFWRVARRGDVFPRRPTARLRQEEARRRLSYVKFLGRGAVSVGSMESRPAAGETPWSSATPLPLPLYTLRLPPPPPAYGPHPTLPPYESGPSSS